MTFDHVILGLDPEIHILDSIHDGNDKDKHNWNFSIKDFCYNLRNRFIYTGLTLWLRLLQKRSFPSTPGVR